MGMPPVPADSGALGLSWQPERRRRVRRNVVDSQLVTVDLGFQKGALLLDVSEEGMGVQALSRAPLGTTTSLYFDLPDTLVRVEGTGLVTWTDNSGRIGLRFGELSSAAKIHLEQWLSRQNNGSVAATGIDQLPTWPPLEQKDEVEAMLRDIREHGLEQDAALGYIVQRITVLTRATGAAIALGDGERMVCAATCGNAPDVGVELNPHSGLSGECVRSGEIVRCEDTETDPRADRLVCRRLDIRSAVILPLRCQQWLGVVEVFSDLPHAFQSTDVLLLRRVTDLVRSWIAAPDSNGTAEPAAPTSVPPRLPPEKPVLLSIAEVPVADILQPSPPPLPPPEQLHLSQNLSPAAPPQESPVAEASARQVEVFPLNEAEEPAPLPVPDVTPSAVSQTQQPQPAVVGLFINRSAAASPAATAPATVSIPRRVRKDEWTKLRPATRPDAHRRARRAAGRRTSGSRIVLGTVLTAALLVGAWQLYVSLAVPGDSSSAAATTSPQPSASVPPNAQAAAVPATSQAPPPKIEKANAAPSRGARESGGIREPDVAVRHFAASPTPADNESSAPPPSLEVPANAAAIADVLKPAASAPTLAPAAGLSGGRLLQRFEPAYPELARRMKVEGPVLLRATVGKNGRVQSVEVVSGSPLLASAAVAAVKRWRYEAFRLNGKTVESETLVNINFVLTR